jgi:hypothetical protein
MKDSAIADGTGEEPKGIGYAQTLRR